jgi:hypothetical protein
MASTINNQPKACASIVAAPSLVRPTKRNVTAKNTIEMGRIDAFRLLYFSIAPCYS